MGTLWFPRHFGKALRLHRRGFPRALGRPGQGRRPLAHRTLEAGRLSMNVDLISGPLIWHWHDPQKKPHGRLLLLKRGLDVPGRANLNPACRPHPESHSGRLLQVPHCASGYFTGSPLVAGLYGTLYHMGLQIGLRHSLDWQHDLTGPLPLPNPMKSPNPCLISSFRFLSQIGGVVTTLAGGLALARCVPSFALLRDLPYVPQIFPLLTAVNFSLAGLSLLLLRPLDTERPSKSWRVLCGRACATAVGVIGLVSLVERRLDVQVLPVSEAFSPTAGLMRGLMGGATALSFVFIAVALLLVSVRTDPNRPLTDLPVILPLLLAMLGIMDGVFDPARSEFHMHLSTALALFVLTLSILNARPDRGFMAIVTSDSSGGMLARRLLPFSFVLLLGLGWARYRAEWSGLFSSEMGVALNTTAGIVILSAVVIGIAGSIERRDEELRRVDEVSLKERSRAQELMAQLQRTNEALQSEIAELRKKGS